MKLNTKELILCSIFAALTSVLAQISVPLPFTTILLTMQVFAIAITGLMLGSKCGFISVIIYLLLGCIGVPVFSNFSGGIGALLGPDGGFLISFPLMAWIIGYFKEKFNSSYSIIIGMLLGLLFVYIIGTVMFSSITGNTIYQSIIYCAVPFIIPDLIKLCLAYVIGTTVSKRVILSTN
ncbi:MAG: biotin transporter BioY [Terrisporobacter sp.]